MGKTGSAGLELDDFNDFSELWAIGVVSSCPVPGLDDLGQGKEIIEGAGFFVCLFFFFHCTTQHMRF